MLCESCNREQSSSEFPWDLRATKNPKRMKVCMTCKPVYAPPTSGESYCSDCGETKPISEFNIKQECAPRPAKNQPGGINYYCRDCDSDRWLMTKFRLTREEYNVLLEKDRRRCYLCRKALGRIGHPLWSPVCDHIDLPDGGKLVLGIAHNACNIGAGRFGDDAVRMARVALGRARRLAEHGLLSADDAEQMRDIGDEMLGI